MTEELKPCPHCGKVGETRVEGKGQIWRGVKGYSEPNYWELTHFCRGIIPDDYAQGTYTLRARSREQIVEAWNTRPPMQDSAQDMYEALSSIAHAVYTGHAGPVELAQSFDDQAHFEKLVLACLESVNVTRNRNKRIQDETKPL